MFSIKVETLKNFNNVEYRISIMSVDDQALNLYNSQIYDKKYEMKTCYYAV